MNASLRLTRTTVARSGVPWPQRLSSWQAPGGPACLLQVGIWPRTVSRCEPEVCFNWCPSMLIHYRCYGRRSQDSETPVISSPKNWMIGPALLILAGINYWRRSHQRLSAFQPLSYSSRLYPWLRFVFLRGMAQWIDSLSVEIWIHRWLHVFARAETFFGRFTNCLFRHLFCALRCV